jgi:DNA-binding GntR family transcriptional regulator
VSIDSVQSVVSNGNDHVVPREREMPSRRVEADLRRRIETNEWASGQALPSIASLAEHYGVSRATVAKALRRMADDGLVEVVPQWGTFRT